MKFLGFIIGADGIKVDPDKIKAITAWPQPTDIGELRSFLGIATYFRRHIRGFAHITTPLTALLKDAAKFIWSAACTEAFTNIKHALTHAPVLALPDFTETEPDSKKLKYPFTVICDASNVALGALLLQNEHPVAYESRKMIAAELNYITTEQELLAVVHAFTVWRCYLEADNFTVVTDHNPLTFFQTKATLSRRQLRWQEFISIQIQLGTLARQDQCS